MAPDRPTTFAGVSVASLAIALSFPPAAVADNPSWNGQYAITFMVGPKAGTSMAVGNPEVQHTETYGSPLELCERAVRRDHHQWPSAD